MLWISNGGYRYIYFRADARQNGERRFLEWISLILALSIQRQWAAQQTTKIVVVSLYYYIWASPNSLFVGTNWESQRGLGEKEVCDWVKVMRRPLTAQPPRQGSKFSSAPVGSLTAGKIYKDRDNTPNLVLLPISITWKQFQLTNGGYSGIVLMAPFRNNGNGSFFLHCMLLGKVEVLVGCAWVVKTKNKIFSLDCR